MRNFLRKHLGTLIVATVAAMVAAGGIGLAHDADGGGHDKFAHKAGTATKAVKLSKIVIQRSAAGSVNVGSFSSREVKCPSGFFVTGGGAAGSVLGVGIVQSYASDGTGSGDAGHTAWWVIVTNTSSIQRTFRAYAVCVKAANVGSNYSPGNAAV